MDNCKCKDLEEYINDLQDLISEATPLAWIGTENVDAAQLWEMRAEDILKQEKGKN